MFDNSGKCWIDSENLMLANVAQNFEIQETGAPPSRDVSTQGGRECTGRTAPAPPPRRTRPTRGSGGGDTKPRSVPTGAPRTARLHKVPPGWNFVKSWEHLKF